jgi:hypothetical protein
MNAPCSKCGKPTNSHVLTPRRRYCHTCWVAFTDEERQKIEQAVASSKVAAGLSLLIGDQLKEFELIEGEEKK